MSHRPGIRYLPPPLISRMLRPRPIKPNLATDWILPEFTTTVMLCNTAPSRVLTTFTLVRINALVEDAGSACAQIRLLRQAKAISELLIAPDSDQEGTCLAATGGLRPRQTN